MFCHIIADQRYNSPQNSNNNNYNHKLQRTKSKSDLSQNQQQTNMNNVYAGATSGLWNTQQQHDRYVVKEHYQHQGKCKLCKQAAAKKKLSNICQSQ